ncbi:MAG: hypothetical protein B6D41_00880 [Chloroflexi bacterium UTCFX4]|nr:MAG: hypothetical protein B6D41_00880 [Chloroflexi bacterium UTCFX4]
MPTRIFTVGKVVAVNFVHLPLQGKVTFIDIADEENTELLYRYYYPSSKFRKFAGTLAIGTYVVAEGIVSHHKIQSPHNDLHSTLMVVGKVLRVLRRPPHSQVTAEPNENAPP